MSGDGQSHDNSGRPDLFQPHSLTHEEAELLKVLKREAALRRGYPTAILCGGLAAIATKRLGNIARITITAMGAVTGNVVGRISYLPTIQKRLISDLPESSPLRQKMMQIKDKGIGPDTLASMGSQLVQDGHSDHGTEFDTGSEYEQAHMQPHEEDTKFQRKYVTYEELRNRHREAANVNTQQRTRNFENWNNPAQTKSEPSGEDQTPSSGQFQPDSDPPKKVRYNKYGDEILE